jgi:O-antigen/teichoic acid export membrane protein
VSKWLVAANCGAYLEQRIDKLLLGRQASAGTVGAYALADDIAGLPGTELFQPLNRALLPALVAERDAAARRRAFLLAFAIHCIIGFPAGVGLALVAAPLVHVALGPGWDDAIPILRVLAFAALAVAVSAAGRYVLLAAGRTRSLAMLSWLQVMIFLIAIASLGSITAESIASLRVGAAGIVALLTLAQLPRCISALGWMDVIQGMARPAAATIVMAGCVTYVESVLAADTEWQALVALVATGVATYTASLAMLWLGAGRPTGGERFLVENIARRFARN